MLKPKLSDKKHNFMCGDQRHLEVLKSEQYWDCCCLPGSILAITHNKYKSPENVQGFSIHRVQTQGYQLTPWFPVNTNDLICLSGRHLIIPSCVYMYLFSVMLLFGMVLGILLTYLHEVNLFYQYQKRIFSQNFHKIDRLSKGH